MYAGLAFDYHISDTPTTEPVELQQMLNADKELKRLEKRFVGDLDVL